MKKILTFFGITFLVLIIIVIAGVALVAIKGNKLDSESKAYVDTAFLPIVSDWNKEELIKRASPELMAVTKDGDLDKAMTNVDTSTPNILLSHDPSHWSNIVLKSKYNIDLQLSGHTHGMQFGLETKTLRWSPVKWRYPKWAGLYKEGKQMLYVNRGLGFLGFPGRVGIWPEITLLNLRPA